MIYGNPSLEIVQEIKDSILLREWNRIGVLEPLKQMPYPDEMATQRELWQMTAMAKNVDSLRLQYIESVDEYLYEVMSEYIGTLGVTVSADEIQQQLSLYKPIINYLKVFYNRPRPFQTAGVYNIPLYPLLESKTAGTGSYPSGHTLQVLLFRHIYMERNPDLARPLMQFTLDVARTREEGGMHYPSDNLFSMRIYKHLKPWMTAQKKIYTMGLDKINGY